MHDRLELAEQDKLNAVALAQMKVAGEMLKVALARRPHQPAPGARWFAEKAMWLARANQARASAFIQETVLSDIFTAIFNVRIFA